MKVSDAEHKIVLSRLAYAKMRYYTDLVREEILGMLLVSLRGGNIIVEDILVPKQKITFSSCDPTDEGMAEILSEIDEPEKFRGWWHSHSSMGTFFSGTDTRTIDNIGKGPPYLVSLVTNRQGEILGRVDMFLPFRVTIDMDVEIDWEDPEVMEYCNQEIAAKVVKKSYQGFQRTGGRVVTGNNRRHLQSNQDAATKTKYDWNKVWDPDKKEWVDCTDREQPGSVIDTA
jgi:proteasome lid subunit RPN8/RPN11